MARLLIIIVTLCLPLQFAWSAASAYCQHETSDLQSRHLGHHAHVHEGHAGADARADASADKKGDAESGAKNGAKSDAKKAAPAKIMADADCVSCHAASHAVMSMSVAECSFTPPGADTAVAAAMPPIASALARAPDRPQWRRLA